MLITGPIGGIEIFQKSSYKEIHPMWGCPMKEPPV